MSVPIDENLLAALLSAVATLGSIRAVKAPAKLLPIKLIVINKNIFLIFFFSIKFSFNAFIYNKLNQYVLVDIIIEVIIYQMQGFCFYLMDIAAVFYFSIKCKVGNILFIMIQ